MAMANLEEPKMVVEGVGEADCLNLVVVEMIGKIEEMAGKAWKGGPEREEFLKLVAQLYGAPSAKMEHVTTEEDDWGFWRIKVGND